MKVKLRDLTPEQYDKWDKDNCSIEKNCKNCLFRSVECGTSHAVNSWVNNKDLYSDKFLDQEIEIEDEPLLTDKEKEYLENVIKPFKDRVLSIKKQENYFTKQEYIFLRVDGEPNMTFPDFEENKYYKNLEIDKEYTLEELGLFEDE